MNIFVIDDSQIDRKLLITTLQKAGADCGFVEASDGKEALEVLKKIKSNICLVLLDWQLPKVDGLEILKQIARDPETASVPVIMMTAANAPEDEEIARLLNPKLCGFLIKPIDPEKVVAMALPYAQ